MILQAAPQLRFQRFGERISAAVSEVLQSDRCVLGEQVERFESQWAAHLGMQRCVGVNSGTDALELALRALRLPAGSEVITPSLTAAGTGAAILGAGLTPCLVDIDPRTRNIHPDAVRSAVNSRTTALVPVHLHGAPCDMQALMSIARRHHLAVVEDCAQAHEATIGGQVVGSFGNAAAFSFYPTKNLGAMGDAGAVVTNDLQLAERVRSMRCYGWRQDLVAKQRLSCELARNSRLDEVQAAILNVLLPHLSRATNERRAAAARYREAFSRLAADCLPDIILPLDVEGAVYHQFAIGVSHASELAELLEHAGIQTGCHYSHGLHQQPLFADYASQPLPHTERFTAGHLSLPIQPEVVAGHEYRIAAEVASAIRQVNRVFAA